MLSISMLLFIYSYVLCLINTLNTIEIYTGMSSVCMSVHARYQPFHCGISVAEVKEREMHHGHSASAMDTENHLAGLASTKRTVVSEGHTMC